MAESGDSNGGYGGTSTPGLCWISPSDLAGQVFNLMAQVAQMQSELNALKATNITAEQLSDISELLGLITGGAVILPDGSWAGTGGSIPVPNGFSGTVVSGNVITTWTDGVVSFQVIPGTGAVSGTFVKVDKFFGFNPFTYTTASVYHVLKGFTVENVDGITSVNPTTGQIHFNTHGMFLVGYAGLQLAYPVGAGAEQTATHGFGNGAGAGYSSLETTEAISENKTYFFSGTYLFFNDGSITDLYLQIFDNGTGGGTRSVDLSTLFIIKLKDA